MAARLPARRPPTHPGEMISEFLVDLQMSQTDFAAAVGISRVRLNELIRGKRAMTPDTALRLERTLRKPAYWWLGLQQDYDLWHALHRDSEMKRIRRLKRLLKSA